MKRNAVEVAPEIAHILFVDIVGYTIQPTSAQSRLLGDLTRLVSESPTFREAKACSVVLPLPTGDGMALLFFDDVLAPARCATEVAGQVNGLSLRMGIHSGLIQRQKDIANSENVVGEGINTAQRVMDAAEDGHILLSAQYASWLKQFEQWAPFVLNVGTVKAKHGQEISVFSLFGPGFGRAQPPAGARRHRSGSSRKSDAPLRIVVLYRRKTKPDDQVLAFLEAHLTEMGHDVFVDRHLRIGVDWAKAIEGKIRGADVVVAILSDAATGSEMLEYELETARDEYRKRGKPYLMPVRIGTDSVVGGPIGCYVNGLNFSVWHGPQDNERILRDLLTAMSEPQPGGSEEKNLEPVGGAVSPDSPFYVDRETDIEFTKALEANESILLIKGPRQIGKTSTIGRGAKRVDELGWRSAATDFQKVSASRLASDDAFYKLLAATLARQLGFTYDFANEWLDVFGANMNMDNFVRAAIGASSEPLVWFMDEADKLFGLPFASDFFGLVRSWHNSRATDPRGPWSRFTVVIAYATEAHLFIQDLNQSPFNVGRQLLLANFTLEQALDLNERYESPMTRMEVRSVWDLTGGQPFLIRRAMDVLSRGMMDYATLIESSARDDGPFGDHLKRILVSVSQIPTVLQALKGSMRNLDFQETEGMFRLIAAGVLRQSSDRTVTVTCDLYRNYLSAHI